MVETREASRVAGVAVGVHAAVAGRAVAARAAEARAAGVVEEGRAAAVLGHRMG